MRLYQDSIEKHICSPFLGGSLIEFGPWGINLGAMWSEAGNWIQVIFLHVVIKVTRGKRRRGRECNGGRRDVGTREVE